MSVPRAVPPERVVRELLEEWRLVLDGDPPTGHRSHLLPVREESGRAAMLKVGPPDEGAAQAHLALQHWQGRGAALLRRADPRRRALLLERLGPGRLDALPDDEACTVLAGLYSALHLPAPPWLPRLSDRVRRHRDRLLAVPRGAPVPHRLVAQAASLARALGEDPATDGVLLHGDLHPGAVLAGDREPWLAVAPRPVSGDPHAEVAPALWHRWDRVLASGDARRAVRARFHALVDAAGLDEDRARGWAVLTAVSSAVSELDGPDPGGGRATRWVTVAKAVQD